MSAAEITLRQQAVIKAQDIFSYQPLFLDTETTGLSANDEVVEISVVDHHGKEVFQSLIKPGMAIPYDSSRINRITNEMVAEAPSWPAIWERLGPLLQDRLVCIYNAEFDMRILRQTHQKWKLPWKDIFSPVCAMKLFAAYQGEWNAQKNDFRFFSLEKACELFNLSVENTHRATADTLLTYALMKRLAELNEP